MEFKIEDTRIYYEKDGKVLAEIEFEKVGENNYGWKDKTEMEIRKDPIEDLTPLSELLKGDNK